MFRFDDFIFSFFDFTNLVLLWMDFVRVQLCIFYSRFVMAINILLRQRHHTPAKCSLRATIELYDFSLQKHLN